MLSALLAVVRALRSAWLIEAVGACLIVAGSYEAWGAAAALGTGGAALVLKAYDIESRQ